MAKQKKTLIQELSQLLNIGLRVSRELRANASHKRAEKAAERAEERQEVFREKNKKFFGRELK